ncbi:MAG: hypothetical protein WBB38_10030 [Hyphomicrobiaceae bacterium]
MPRDVVGPVSSDPTFPFESKRALQEIDYLSMPLKTFILNLPRP